MPSEQIAVNVSSSTACSGTISVNSSYKITSVDFYGYGADSTNRYYSYTLALSTQGSITNYPAAQASGSAYLTADSYFYLGSVSCDLSSISSLMVGAKNISASGKKLYIGYVIVNYESIMPATSNLYVSYSASGASNVPSPHYISGTYDSSQGQYYYSGYLSSTIPTKTGYTFSHWSATGLSGNYSPGGLLQGWGPANDSVTFVANWTANKYTISYNANGGTGAPASQTKTHDVNLTLSSTKPTRTGYTFSGWGTSSTTTTVSYAAGATYTGNANATLYAIWKANTYSVKYNANGGSGTMSDSSHTYDTAKALTANAFKRPGYEFLGWATSATATTINYTDKQSVKNLTSTNGATFNLYAIWELMSNIRIYDGSTWKLAIPYVYEGGKWVLAVSKIYDGSWRQ